MTKLFVAFATSALLALGMVSVALAGGGAPRVASLTGPAEVGGGDADGSGFAEIRLNHGQGTVCWEVSVADIDAPLAAHIHRATAGVNGPVVVALGPIEEGCAVVDKALVKDIIRHPANYYVNVHNAAFPGGAIRGQLSNPGQAN